MDGPRDGSSASAEGCPSLSLFGNDLKLISVFFNRHSSMVEGDSRERVIQRGEPRLEHLPSR